MPKHSSPNISLRRHLLTAVLAVAFALGGGVSTSFANQPGPASPTSPGQTVATGSASMAPSAVPLPSSRPASVAESYAAREASAPQLQSFKGGDVVIIGGTGLVIVLLVILILVIA